MLRTYLSPVRAAKIAALARNPEQIQHYTVTKLVVTYVALQKLTAGLLAGTVKAPWQYRALPEINTKLAARCLRIMADIRGHFQYLAENPEFGTDMYEMVLEGGDAYSPEIPSVTEIVWNLTH
jgi:hypothetical protein